MTDQSPSSRVNWRQAGGEALLICLGVAVALIGQAWWEYRGDRQLERHLLEGIHGDLMRDSVDIASAMGAALARVSGADRLLSILGDPDAGQLHDKEWEVGRPGVALGSDDWLDRAFDAHPPESISVGQALYMVVATSSLQRIDVSDATFREATAGGQLDVIRDLEMRTSIADYYFNVGRFGDTTDNRVEPQWLEFRQALAEAGLSSIGGEPDSVVVQAFRSDPRLVAGLKNVRDFALSQVGAQGVVMSSADSVLALLSDVLSGR